MVKIPSYFWVVISEWRRKRYEKKTVRHSCNAGSYVGILGVFDVKQRYIHGSELVSVVRLMEYYGMLGLSVDFLGSTYYDANSKSEHDSRRTTRNEQV